MKTLTFAYRSNRAAGFVICMTSAFFLMLFLAGIGHQTAGGSLWLGLGLFSALCIYGLRLVRASFRAERHVVLTPDALVAPPLDISAKVIAVPYTSIRRVYWFPKFLWIRHAAGLVCITKASMQGSTEFKMFYEALEARVGVHKSL